jgi:transposase
MNTQQTATPSYSLASTFTREVGRYIVQRIFSLASPLVCPLTRNNCIKYVLHFPGHEVSVAYEAGCCGYHAHRCFEGYDWRSLVVNPADIHRKGKERHTKTDRIDAQLISRELKDGRLESIIVPDKKREELRSLFRRRNDLVKDFRPDQELHQDAVVVFRDQGA